MVVSCHITTWCHDLNHHPPENLTSCKTDVVCSHMNKYGDFYTWIIVDGGFIINIRLKVMVLTTSCFSVVLLTLNYRSC
jgi:hypothetical protein